MVKIHTHQSNTYSRDNTGGAANSSSHTVRDVNLRVWNFLRLPAILLIVIAHCSPFDLPIFADGDYGHGVSGSVVLTNRFINYYLMQSSMIFFFIAAGFMFFLKGASLSLSAYSAKLRRRVNTLLIPYLIWNALGMILWLAKNRSLLPDLTSNPLGYDGLIHTLTAGFFSLNGTPFDFPLWFLRNLIIAVVCTPLLAIMIRNCRALSPIVLILISAIPSVNYLRIPECIAYFALGGTWSALTQHRDYTLPRWIPAVCGIYTMLCMSIFLYLKFTGIEFPYVVEYLFSLTARCALIIATISLCSHVLQRKSSLRTLNARAVFFIFAFHGLYSSWIRKAVAKFVVPDSDVRFTVNYLLTSLIVLGFAYLAIIVTRRYFPSIYALLTGADKRDRSPLFL